MGFLGSLGKIAGAALGIGIPTAASAMGQAAQNRWAAAQAQKQMDFQERMSSTAHQREVRDLMAAGLNPILSVNSGESTPGGAMATGESPLVAGVSTAQDARRLKLETAQTGADLAVKGSVVNLNKALKDKAVAETPMKHVIGAVASSAEGLFNRGQQWIRDRLDELDEKRLNSAVMQARNKKHEETLKRVRAGQNIRQRSDIEWHDFRMVPDTTNRERRP